MAAQDRNITLLAETTVTAAVSATVTAEIVFDPKVIKTATMYGVLTYGSGGTDLPAFLQTSLDGGLTWTDIICLRWATTTENRVASVSRYSARAVAVGTTGALSDNSVLDGVLGDRVRLSWSSPGTYGGSTTIKIDLILG